MVVVEDPNLHLLWIDARLFVKPLPEFLVFYEVWRGYVKSKVSSMEQLVCLSPISG